MLEYVRSMIRICLAFTFIVAGGTSVLAQAPPPDQAPVNVAGKWTIYSRGDDGKTATKFVELQQNGDKLSGHFKGPNQSGGVEGTIEGRHVVFYTKTRNKLTFRGQADGVSMHGTWGIFVPRQGLKHGTWEARHSE